MSPPAHNFLLLSKALSGVPIKLKCYCYPYRRILKQVYKYDNISFQECLWVCCRSFNKGVAEPHYLSWCFLCNSMVLRRRCRLKFVCHKNRVALFVNKTYLFRITLREAGLCVRALTSSWVNIFLMWR